MFRNMASAQLNTVANVALKTSHVNEEPKNSTDSLTVSHNEASKQTDYSDNSDSGQKENTTMTVAANNSQSSGESGNNNGVNSKNDGNESVNGRLTKKSRRVCFHDHKLVSGYMDPPNPWNDASTCSTEELVCAYKFACEKHGIKPIPKLLHQLQAINDFCDRNETLTLKGERIDYKHCDTFEEVLRRVQFRTFDLEGTHLDEEGAIALFDMIEYYESCTKLNLSFNKNIGIRGWQSCARMLKKTPCIEQLDARSTGLSEQVMPMLGRALRLGSQLTVLHLESAILSGRPLMILVTAIKMNEILRELYLADNKLMPSDGIQLGNMLKFNHKLALLDLRNNHLQDVGTSHLCDGLYEQSLGCGLNTLVLWNNQITYQSMPSLARALTTTKSLETLNLGHNNITNEGIHRLKEGLLHNKSLLRIGLQASKVTCEGAVAVAEFIADSPRLLRIDLRENDIKTAGLMALSLSLKVSETVTRIDLDKEPKRETSESALKGMRDYADQQRRLLQDISNLMLRNRDILRQKEEEERQQRAREKETEKQIEEAKKDEKEVVTETEAESGKDDVPEVVALDDAVPQLIVPKDEQDNTGDENRVQQADENNKNVVELCKEVIEKETEMEKETKEETLLKDIEKLGIAEKDEQGDLKDGVEIEDIGEGVGEAARKGEQFRLDLPLTSRTMTLESPAFIPESALPVVTPPNEEDVQREVAARNAAQSVTSPEYNPVTFPPSPMVGTAKPFAPLSSSSSETQNVDSASDVRMSPNTRRKFVISRVEESASPLVKENLPRIEHSNVTKASASGDAASSQSQHQMSSFQSPGNGNQGDGTESHCSSDHSVEQVSSAGIVTRDESDVNDENPETGQVSSATSDIVTSESSQLSEETSSKIEGVTTSSCSSSTDNIVESSNSNSAKPVKIQSNETSSSNPIDASEPNSTASFDNSTPNDTNHNKTTEAQKFPDFHTNLSLNGMKSELANVIDSLDKPKPLTTKSASEVGIKQGEDDNNESPDDFEKELDELLANLPPSPAVLQNKSTSEDSSLPSETAIEQQS